jgi:hypothetical protein
MRVPSRGLSRAGAVVWASSCGLSRASAVVWASSCGRRRAGAAGRVPLGERGDSSVEGPLPAEARAPALRASLRSPGQAVTWGSPTPFT